MMNDLKGFLLKGNVVDLAVAVIIGAAFNKIVTSFVNDMLMPPIGMLLGGVNFTDLKATLTEATDEVAAVTVNYGAFIQTIIDFLIIGITVFMVVKMYEKMQKKEEAKPEAPKGPTEVELLTEIRDSLKK